MSLNRGYQIPATWVKKVLPIADQKQKNLKMALIIPTYQKKF